LAVLPSIIANAVEASVSIARIQKFLTSAEVDPQAVIRDSSKASSEFDAAVSMSGCTMFWDDESRVSAVSDMSLKLKPGSLTLVIGKTGCGKSALLQGLCGELKVSEQGTTLKGKVTYAAQVPWIQNCTIEENIRFGVPMNRALYEKTLKACCLTTDLQILDGGDQTEIGEKGINLSGGQKARVALARAVYSKPDGPGPPGAIQRP
jgi:ABC-type bacteriocin/lantibiotic exporter with double-glycine peptidase domain